MTRLESLQAAVEFSNVENGQLESSVCFGRMQHPDQPVIRNVLRCTGFAILPNEPHLPFSVRVIGDYEKALTASVNAA
jgi:hypothetical protein